MASKWLNTPSIRDRILKKNTFNGIWNRTLTIMVILVTISLISIFYFLHLSTKNMEDNISRSLQYSTEQRKINIDFRLSSIQQLDTNLIALIYPYTYSGANQSEQFVEYAELNAILSTYTAHEDVSSVRLFMSDDKLYSHQGGTYYPLSSLVRNVPNPDYLEHAGAHWTETHQIPLTKRPGGSQIASDVLTLVHTMRHRNNYETIACALMLDIEVSKFDEMLSADENPDCVGYLINTQGTCLASPHEEFIHQTVIAPELMESICAQKQGCISSNKRVYVFSKLDYNDWFIVMDYPASILSVSNSTQGNVLQIMIIVALVVALTLVFIFAYNYTVNATLSRINSTLDTLNLDESDPLEEPSQLPNPLHQLEQNADQIVLTVKELLENRYKDQIAIAESQMKSLQAQIKPHFLYNTLDIIKWMILDQRNDEAALMVNTLSKYLRQSINKGPGIIPLQEELELSKTYISIMQTRFKNRFTVNFDIEDAAESYLIPKLSLQPLLENALLHGILYCEKAEKELSVRAWVADGSVYIEVEDNGNGMPAETVQALEESSLGYGLGNVRKRLSLFSRGNGSFHIFSREGFGTCIAIQLPAITSASDAENL